MHGERELDDLIAATREVERMRPERSTRLWRGFVAGIGASATLGGGTAAASATGHAAPNALGASTTSGSIFGATWVKVGIGAGILALGAAVPLMSRVGDMAEVTVTSQTPNPKPGPQQSFVAAPAEAASELPKAAEAQPRPAAPEPKHKRVKSTPAPVDNQLAQEVELLSSAKQALDRGDAARSLSLVNQYAQKFPRGALRGEATATRLLALCATGKKHQAQQEAKRLNPNSPLAKRLKSGCLAP